MSRMFLLRLKDPKADLLLRAVEAFTRLPYVIGDMYVSGNYLTLIADNSYHNPPSLVLSLRIPSTSFSHFYCKQSLSLSLHLQDFINILPQTTNVRLLEISGLSDPHKITIGFTDYDRSERRMEMKLMIPIEAGKMKLKEPDFECEYEVIVGIPSRRFRSLARHLHQKLHGVKVNAIVTDTQVIFLVGDDAGEAVILSTELGHCVILGHVPVKLVFSVDYNQAIMDASGLSSTVWFLLVNSIGSFSVMFNCPLAGLGNLMFYF